MLINDVNVMLEYAEYENGNLAIIINEVDESGDVIDYYADLTVNVTKLPPRQALVDTNNCPWAESFIQENHLGKYTGKNIPSGYCTYPIYEFV